MSVRRCFLCEKRTAQSATLHGFPKDNAIRLLWLEVCNLNELDDVSTIKICSEHFTTDDYRNPLAPVYGGVLKLKTGVIPTLSVPNPIAPVSMSVNNKDTDVESTTNVAGTSEEIGSEYVTISEEQTSTATCDISQEENSLPVILFTSTNNPNEVGLSSTPGMSEQVADQAVDVTNTTNEDKSISKKVPYYEPRYVGDKSFLECPSVTHAKLRLRLAKSTVIKLRRKVSILQQKNRRLTKKVNTLEDLVFILKNS